MANKHLKTNTHDIGFPGQSGISVTIETVRLTSNSPNVTLDCGECLFNTPSNEELRSVTIDGSLSFNIDVELTGVAHFGAPAGDIDFPFATLTAYTFSTDVLRATTAINETASNAFVLNQNYPNPFSNSTNVEFVSPTTGTVDFTVYDMTGKLVEFRKVF